MRLSFWYCSRQQLIPNLMEFPPSIFSIASIISLKAFFQKGSFEKRYVNKVHLLWNLDKIYGVFWKAGLFMGNFLTLKVIKMPDNVLDNVLMWLLCFKRMFYPLHLWINDILTLINIFFVHFFSLLYELLISIFNKYCVRLYWSALLWLWYSLLWWLTILILKLFWVFVIIFVTFSFEILNILNQDDFFFQFPDDFIVKWLLFIKLFLSTVPDGPPKKVRVEALNSTTLRIRWQPPAEHRQHGVVRGYQVHYAQSNQNGDFLGEGQVYWVTLANMRVRKMKSALVDDIVCDVCGIDWSKSNLT